MFLYFENGYKELLSGKDLYDQFMSDENKEQRDNGTTFNEYVKDLIDRQLIYIDTTCTNCETENDVTFLEAVTFWGQVPIIIVECNECNDKIYL